MITTRSMDAERARVFFATHDVVKVMKKYPEADDIELRSDWIKLGCYLTYREQGVEHRWAMMSAVRRAPQMKNSDRTFNEGARRRMNSMHDANMKKILQLAKSAGVNTQGKFYCGGLGRYTDQAAWVSTTDDMLAAARKKNLNLEGVVNHKGREVDPPKPKELAPDLVRNYMIKECAADPALKERCRKSAKARGELREKVIAKHGKKRK